MIRSKDFEALVIHFAAERLVHNQKVEAAALHVSASPQGILVKGDARIGGSTPAAIEYRAGEPVEAKGKSEPVPVWQAVQATVGAAFALAMGCFITYTHRANIARLRAGNENRFHRAMIWRKKP